MTVKAHLIFFLFFGVCASLSSIKPLSFFFFFLVFYRKSVFAGGMETDRLTERLDQSPLAMDRN